MDGIKAQGIRSKVLLECFLLQIEADDPGDNSETRTKASLTEQVVTNPLTSPADSLL